MLNITGACSHAPSLKNTLLSCPYFVKKRPFSQQHCALMIFFHEKHPAVMPIFGWIKWIVSKLHIGKKSQKETKIFRFTKKSSPTLMAIFCKKKRSYSRKNAYLMPIFWQKNVNFLKNTVLSCIFFKCFVKNPIVSCPSLFKQASIPSKLRYIMGPKSQ